MMNLTRVEKRNLRNGLLFISPWILGFCIFALYPILSSFRLSLTRYNVISEPKFVGLDNYINLFTADKQFQIALGNTLYMILFGVTAVILFTLTISILLNDKRIKGIAFYRILFFIPSLVPLIVLCILWYLILNPNTGIVNGFLGAFGITGPGWFSSQTWSKPALIIMKVWASGNFIIIFLGGLQNISKELYEAASIDGGGFLAKTFYISIPLLKPVILYNIVTAIIYQMQDFAAPFILTGGGPADSTNFYGLYLYNSAFKYGKMGYASAMAWIMLMISLMLTLSVLKFMGWKEGDQ